MKQSYFHLIYLSIIAFLGYNYWSSVQALKALPIMNSQLNVNSEAMRNAVEFTCKAIEKGYKQYPNPFNLASFSKSQNAVKIVNDALDFIKKNKSELNLDTINSLNYKLNSPNNSFFTDNKIAEIRNELVQFSNAIIKFISGPKSKQVIENQLTTIKIISNEYYWQSLKYQSLNGVLMQLSFLENQIKLDEITLLNYLYFEQIQKAGESIEFDSYKTAIAPRKAALIEGETFEADIYIAKYASNPINATITVNGKTLEIKDGVVHFKSKKQSIGVKKIIAESIIKNPWTGNTITTQGSFEYEVLPKCHRDCQ
jgi:hypothetical protein